MKIYIITFNEKLSTEAYKTLKEAQKFIYYREGMQGVVDKPEDIEFRVQDRNANLYSIYEVIVKE